MVLVLSLVIGPSVRPLVFCLLKKNNTQKPNAFSSVLSVVSMKDHHLRYRSLSTIAKLQQPWHLPPPPEAHPTLPQETRKYRRSSHRHHGSAPCLPFPKPVVWPPSTGCGGSVNHRARGPRHDTCDVGPRQKKTPVPVSQQSLPRPKAHQNRTAQSRRNDLRRFPFPTGSSSVDSSGPCGRTAAFS